MQSPQSWITKMPIKITIFLKNNQYSQSFSKGQDLIYIAYTVY